MLRKFAGVFIAQHLILHMGEANTGLFHKKREYWRGRSSWNLGIMIFLWIYLTNYIICFVLCFFPPTSITNIFFVFPFLSLLCYEDFGYSLTTAAPSGIEIIIIHQGYNTVLYLSFRICKGVCLRSLLIIYLSVFLGTWPKGESCQLPQGVTVTGSDDVCPEVSCSPIIYRGMSNEKSQ